MVGQLGNQSDHKGSSYTTSKYPAKSLGRRAQESLKYTGNASVLGVTSKGIFLQNLKSQVIFLTDENYHGPITVNLRCRLDFSEIFTIGDECRISVDRLVFSNCQILISWDTPVWTPPQIKFPRSGLISSIYRGRELVKALLGRYENGLFLRFLEKIAEESADMDEEKIRDLLPGKACKGRLTDCLLSLVGMGRGLTPAGDDFLCGFLLTGYYLTLAIPSFRNFVFLSDIIAAEAQKKTTSLSASLITCALHGDGDERLFPALLWIAQGEIDIATACDALLSYGSSSGIDAMAGMLSAMLITQNTFLTFA